VAWSRQSFGTVRNYLEGWQLLILARIFPQLLSCIDHYDGPALDTDGNLPVVLIFQCPLSPRVLQSHAACPCSQSPIATPYAMAVHKSQGPGDHSASGSSQHHEKRSCIVALGLTYAAVSRVRLSKPLISSASGLERPRQLK
jgi:hypothetical protein